jgi:hypothetical protein
MTEPKYDVQKYLQLMEAISAACDHYQNEKFPNDLVVHVLTGVIAKLLVFHAANPEHLAKGIEMVQSLLADRCAMLAENYDGSRSTGFH